ncbi:MAG: DUF4197 domain-containing protein [Bacteroidetes bacterium]|nr:DUF4197 domain-containing protein [Bacteroidota bacterium]
MIKKHLLLAFIFTIGCSVSLTAQILNEAMKLIEPASQGLTEKDAVSGIKEALVKGTGASVNLVSKVNGYFGNPEIKIPFPENARTIESKLRGIGLGSQVDEVVLSINRAAEDAAKEAEPIFVSAIRNMTIADAIQIVKGKNDAATQYLSRTTTAGLKEKFTPVVKASLDRVNATRLWEDVVKTYNQIPFVTRQNPDLTGYVTDKAISGLFAMIAKEELKIRQDPAARTTEILKKVFGK